MLLIWCVWDTQNKGGEKLLKLFNSYGPCKMDSSCSMNTARSEREHLKAGNKTTTSERLHTFNRPPKIVILWTVCNLRQITWFSYHCLLHGRSKFYWWLGLRTKPIIYLGVSGGCTKTAPQISDTVSRHIQTAATREGLIFVFLND